MAVQKLSDGSPLTIEWLNSLVSSISDLETKINNVVEITTTSVGDKPAPIPALSGNSQYKIHIGAAVITSKMLKGTAGEVRGIEYGTTFGSANVFVLPYIRSSYISSLQVYGQNKTQFSIKYFNHSTSDISDALLYFMAIGQA